MSKLLYKEASAYNDKIQGHVDSINKLIKVVAKGGVQVYVFVGEDTQTIASNKIPEISVETSIKLS